MKVIVTVEIEVPDCATSKDIQDYIDVEYEGVNSMKTNNPCIDCDVDYVSWEYEG